MLWLKVKNPAYERSGAPRELLQYSRPNRFNENALGGGNLVASELRYGIQPVHSLLPNLCTYSTAPAPSLQQSDD
jgi:hypothetical protein